MCNIAVDAQAYNNFALWQDVNEDDQKDLDEYFGDAKYAMENNIKFELI